MKPRTVSLVIPAFNEEHRLPRLLEVVERQASGQIDAGGFELVETLIVDDGSTDATPELLRARGSAIAGVRPILRGGLNRGKGAAVAAGVAEARGELVLITDVDLSTPLSEIVRFARPLEEGADVVIGSRALDPSLARRAPHRKLLSHAYNLMVRALFRLPFRDTQCGFKLMPSSVARALVESQLIERYSFDVEALVRARSMGLSVAEVPVVWHEGEASRVNVWTTSPRMAWDTLRLRWTLREVLRAGTES